MAQHRRLESAPGSRDHWRVAEDRAATMGQSLSAKGREAAKVDPDVPALSCRSPMSHRLWYCPNILPSGKTPPAPPRNWAVWLQWERFIGKTCNRPPRT